MSHGQTPWEGSVQGLCRIAVGMTAGKYARCSDHTSYELVCMAWWV